MMTFTLRPTTPADIPTLHRLMRDFATYEKLQHRFKITEADLHDALFGPNPPLDSILADIDGTTVGFALWYFTVRHLLRPLRACSSKTSTSTQAHRGRGIGLALFRHMARIARARDCVDMEWHVLDWNTPAIEFYRRIGAKPVRRLDHRSSCSGDALIALAEGAENG